MAQRENSHDMQSSGVKKHAAQKIQPALCPCSVSESGSPNCLLQHPEQQSENQK